MKKKLLLILKLALTVLILYFVFRRIDFRDIIRLSGSIKPSIFILLIITTLIKTLTQFINWDYCLRINSGYNPPKTEVLKTLFIGSALKFLLPGGHASYGKVYFLKASKKKTLISVGMEKFMLTWTILLFGSFAALFYFTQYRLFWRIGVIVFICLIPLLAYWGKYPFRKYEQYFNNCLRIVPVITLSQAVFMFFSAFQFFLIINQFLCFSLSKALLSVPLIMTANTVPITYSGLGLRESFAIHIFTEYGISPEIAVTSSLIIFFINAVIPALIGVVFIILSKDKA